MKPPRLIIAALTVFVAAGGVAAQPAPASPRPAQTTDLPAPAAMTNAGVSKWLHDYIRTDGWAVLAADGQAVALGSPDGVGARADGTLAANVRHEYYKAVQIGGKTTRSNLQSRIIDCANKRHKVIAMDIYEFNNLTGQAFVAANPNAPWQTPAAGSLYLRVLERVCKAAGAQGNRVQ